MRKLILVFLVFIGACTPKETEYLIKGEAQGTTYTIKYIGTEEVSNLKNEVDSLLLAIDNSMSTYKPNSLISALNNGEEIEMDQMFQDVFFRSIKISRITEGAFDPTIGPLISAWGFNYEDPLKMDSILVDSLLTLCGFHQFLVEKQKLKIMNPNSSLNFNAIAQGYSVDLLSELMLNKKVSNFYVELGGELRVNGKNKVGDLWQIGIDKPIGKNLERNLSHIIPLENKAMATSGNYRKFYKIDGKKYSHTLHPKTGFPVSHNMLSATVIAINCMDADAFGTSFMVLGLEKTKSILEANPEIDAVLIYEEKGLLKSYYTQRLESIVIELQ